MKKIYFTITGTNFKYGHDFLEKGMLVSLVKEPDNEYDNEAIKIEVPGIGKIGYVANSVHTVIGDCMSAGRMYDKMDETAEGTVVYVLPQGLVCVLNQVPIEEKVIV